MKIIKVNFDKYPALKPFRFLVEFEDISGTQVIGTCPLCNKTKHFYINRDTGLWDCKSCGEKGNIYTLLSEYTRQVYLETTDKELEPLVKATGLPLHVFKNWSVGWDSEHFLAHCRNTKDTVTNIAFYDSEVKFEKCLWGLQVQLYGMYRLKARARKTKTVWIVEGCKDAWTLSYLLRDSPTDVIVGVPGAGTFKADWAKALSSYEVILCYDHDKAGQAGTQKALNELTAYTKNIKVFVWPKSTPFKEKHGHDISDFYKDLKKKTKFNFQILNRIKKRLRPWKEIKWIEDVKMKSRFVLKRRRLSEIEEKPINWLWKNWVAKGFVNLVVALIGQGKSTLIQKWIADITSKEERHWPNGLIVDCKGSAILLSAEEDIARTIRPRIRKFGGDPNKIEMPPDLVDEKTGEKATLNILEHRHELEKLIQEMPDLQIIVFDPAVEYISRETDINTEMQVREILRILQNIAEEYQIAVIAIAHVNKNTSQYFIHRILGAQAFGARVRIVLGIDDNPDCPDDETRHILAHCKPSLGSRQLPIEFQIIEDTTDGLAIIKYDSAPISNFNIKNLFSPDKRPVGRPAKQEERAEEFLKKALSDGPVPRKKVIEFGEKKKISESTIKRTTRKMNIITKYIEKGKYKGQYCLKLPAQKTEKKRVLRVKMKKRKNGVF